jgi:hypothetical protein
VIGHQSLELLAGVLAAAIGMMQQRVRFAASPGQPRVEQTSASRCT